jgi:N-acetyl-alpha-D-muramate 1-phosphate uridylyltransferase
MKAFILAAGLGTRLKPLTDTKPKALVEVNGITLLELIINRLQQAGFNKIIVNVHHFAGQIIDFLKSKNNFGVDIVISDESDLLLDTGGGLKKIAKYFDSQEPLLIHNVDIFSDIDLGQLYQFHKETGKITTLAVQDRKSSRYFLFDEQKDLCGWKNISTNEVKTTRSSIGEIKQLAFSGIQVVESSIFNYMPDEKVFSLVDLYLSTAKKEQITYFDHTNSTFLDLGKKEKLAEAEKILQKIS